MYFIRRGECAVIVGDKKVGKMVKGKFFGEIALVSLNVRRTATIQAMTFCDLSMLTKNSLGLILDTFPTSAQNIKKRILGVMDNFTDEKGYTFCLLFFQNFFFQNFFFKIFYSKLFLL